MSQIATIAQHANVTAELVQDADSAHDFLLHEKADATRRAYRSDFRIFAAYCAKHGASPMPAAPAILAAWLASQASIGIRASTLTRRVAAIAYAHRLAGLEPPTNTEQVKAVMRGIRRKLGTAKAAKRPATAALVRQMADKCPDTLRGKRNRALLALGFAGAFRRSELVALTVADLVEVPDGLRVTIRQSKTDQEGAGHEIAIPRGARLRPVDAVQDWLRAAGITDGFVFRSIRRGGQVSTAPLAADSVPDLVKEAAEAAGLDASLFSAHSLRAGFLTSAAEAGASVFKLMEVSRHQSIETLRSYIRRADLFRDHAGGAFL